MQRVDSETLTHLVDELVTATTHDAVIIAAIELSDVYISPNDDYKERIELGDNGVISFRQSRCTPRVVWISNAWSLNIITLSSNHPAARYGERVIAPINGYESEFKAAAIIALIWDLKDQITDEHSYLIDNLTDNPTEQEMERHEYSAACVYAIYDLLVNLRRNNDNHTCLYRIISERASYAESYQGIQGADLNVMHSTDSSAFNKSRARLNVASTCGKQNTYIKARDIVKAARL